MDADHQLVTIVESASMTVSSSSASPSVKPRTLILCFDGTADQYDSTNSNVVKLFGLLKKDLSDTEQLCYYQAGVGTYENPSIMSPLVQWGAKMLDEAFAWYLDAHVREGYEFLMQTYRPGDRICLFGFSRGAYTARALAGMLHKVGLLPKDNLQQLPFAYQLYKKTDATSLELAAGFKQTFCRTVNIEFVGVWDTVASVGVVLGKTLPFISDNTTIKTFRHALALDEHRARFRPDLYHRTAPGDDVDEPHAPEPGSGKPVRVEKPEPKTVKKANKWSARFSRKNASNVVVEDVTSVAMQTAGGETVVSAATTGDVTYDDTEDNEPPVQTDVLEVWFAGCHSDVGGGSTANTVKESLSDITLRWMVREIHLARCGVAFDSIALANANIPDEIFSETDGSGPLPAASSSVSTSAGSTAAAPSTSSTSSPTTSPAPAQSTPAAPAPSEGQDPNEPTSEPPQCSAMDAVDAVQPLHDELVLKPAWWLLEIIPLNYTWQDATGKWHNTWSINFGRGRTIYQQNPLFHITVKERMADKALKYTPKAIWTPGTESYVC